MYCMVVTWCASADRYKTVYNVQYKYRTILAHKRNGFLITYF